MFVDSPTDFVVDTSSLARRDGSSAGRVTCTITNPSGGRTENLVTAQPDGTYRISYTPFEEGECTNSTKQEYSHLDISSLVTTAKHLSPSVDDKA